MGTIKRTFQNGFSFVELLAVLSILTVLTTITFSVFSDSKSSQALEKDTETIVETLRQARSETLDSKNATQYGVHFASPKITLFAGSIYTSSDPSNLVFALTSNDTLLTISLTGGGSDVIFNRLSGETAENGTIVVSSGATSRTKTVTIYKTGLVDSN